MTHAVPIRALSYDPANTIPETRSAIATGLASAAPCSRGWLVLMTCRRIEILGSGPRPAPAALGTTIGVAMAADPHVRDGASAIEYVLRLAAGLESAVIGEDQILGQIRALRRTEGAAGSTDGRLVDVRSLTGNVDTRLKRLDAGDIDALVLAVAGLERLGHHDRLTEVFDAARIPPAPGQGALAVQVRRANQAAVHIVACLDDLDTRLAVSTERCLLSALGGGCRAPIGALATVVGESISLVAGRVEPDGQARRDVVRVGSRRAPERLALEAAEAFAR